MREVADLKTNILMKKINNRKYYIKLLENVLRRINVKFLIKSQNNKSNIFKVILSKNDYQYVISIWIAVILALSDKNQILNAFEIPFLFKKKYSFLWIDNLVFVFFKEKEFNVINTPLKPKINSQKILAFGGQSGAGKTTIFKNIKQHYSGRIFNYLSYTTRSPRLNEKNGVDYIFKKTSKVRLYKKNPRYNYFVKARENWYWIDLGDVIQNIWRHPDDLHAFFISQKQDFLAKKKLFSGLKWIWIDATDDVIMQRLKERSDNNFYKSLKYNQKIKKQRLVNIVDLYIKNNNFSQLNKAIKKIIKFCDNLK